MRGPRAAQSVSWCLVALVVFIFFAAHAAELPEWAKARWGMTDRELAASLGDTALRLDPPIDYGIGQAKLFVKGVVVGGVAVNALYQFDAEDRLEQILLERRDAGAVPKNFAAIDRALTEALGKPEIACDRQRGTPRLTERQWNSGATAVHLTFMDFTGAAMTLNTNKDFFDPRVPSYEYETFKRRAFPRRIVLRYFPAANAALKGPTPCG